MKLRKYKLFNILMSYRPDRFVKGLMAIYTAKKRYRLAKINNGCNLKKNDKLINEGFISYKKVLSNSIFNKISNVINNFDNNEACISYRNGKYSEGIIKNSNSVYIKNDFINSCFIAHCHSSDKMHLKAKVMSNSTVLIGPEGDFSLYEIENALENNFVPITLGSSRLRTETAGLMVCQTIALHYEEI